MRQPAVMTPSHLPTPSPRKTCPLALLACALTLAFAAGCATTTNDPDRVPVPAEQVQEAPEPEVRTVVQIVREPADPARVWPDVFLAPGDSGAPAGTEVAGLLMAAGENTPAANTTPIPPAGPLSAEDELRLLAALRDNGLRNDEAFESRARRQLRKTLAELVLEHEALGAIAVSPAEVRARYEATIAQYREPARVNVRLVQVATRAAADAVIERLAAGEAFGDVAREVSLHPSRVEGGRLPAFTRGEYTPALEELAFELDTGAVGSVATARGVFVLQKVSESQERTIPLEEVAPRIEGELLREKRQAAQAQYLEELRRTYP